MNTQIYIALINEGTSCWRPVSAVHLRDDTYQILGEQPPHDECWEFVAGEVVRCKSMTFGDGQTGLVAYQKVAD